MIEVAIIIVSHNTKRLTLQCIKSLLKNKPEASFEIVVVDNASTDGSIEELRKMKNITLIENKKNLGFAKANNQGIRKAKGKYVFLLNSDTRIKKDAIDKLIAYAKEKPDAGAVVPRLLNPDGTTQPSVFKLPTLGRAIEHYWLGGEKVLNKYAPQRTTTVEAAVMAAYLITPAALKKVGSLNEKYFFFFEDMDYCRSLKSVGLKVYYLPTAEVIHLHGESGKYIADDLNQWRRLIPSSKVYHGLVKHYLINFVLWSSQKFEKVFKTRKA